MCALAVFPRKEGDDALARPTREAQIRLQSIVILVVAILSILGAGWIMLSFWVFPNLRSFRHRLILGLAISDFIMALNFLFSTTMNIAGRFIDHPENTAFCSFNGFITQVFVIQTDYWVLTIAVCTYFVLAGHKRPSSWVQDHGVIIWAIPWFFSTLWASLGLAIVGYEDIGAWCWFGSDWIRLAVNFFPRWVIIVTMFLLYAYLWTILYKAHNRLSSVEAVSPENLVSGNATPIVSQPSSFQGSSFRGDLEGRSSGSVRRLKKVMNASLVLIRWTLTHIVQIARLMLLYPLAYAIIWSLPTAIRIYNATEKKPAPFALQTLDKASIVIQGFVDAVIYGVNETSLSSWRLRLSQIHLLGQTIEGSMR
ncbi:hypothetical protein CkaCkLH20_12523 [Colletotrichum karsti]|uniref:G-protein coupled receptor 1 n=1 Tax=Colletotrichum karsti TaxID=1095194 RepID=A0A9P6LE68_9PEZI|nr:uncharacterized protein CkaCkLH20_12523 [Colletotrichum karsti]KAF9870043.1 hypothetical protein CkaCkLH20_12523 [Colletotrichum karsti]